jgi:hypothetical protein
LHRKSRGIYWAVSPEALSAASIIGQWTSPKGGIVVVLWILVALLLLFAIVGGIAITKFLFFVLIIAALLALIGFFTRTA